MSMVAGPIIPKRLKRGPLGKSIWIFLAILLIAAILFLLSRRIQRPALRVQRVSVGDTRDIVPILDSVVTPVVYRNVDVLDQVGMEERKLKFIDAILPAVLIARHALFFDLERIGELEQKMNENEELTETDSAFLANRMAAYGADSLPELKLRLYPHPTSIALAQAALESGWGTSRFFEQANNVFGIWSFSSKERRMRAAASRNGTPVYVRSYDTILESVEDYFRVLGKGNAYSEFRDRRFHTDNVFDLIWYLKKYSEKRTQYVVLLRNVIVANDLTRYDRYRLDSEFHTRSDASPYRAYILDGDEE